MNEWMTVEFNNLGRLEFAIQFVCDLRRWIHVTQYFHYLLINFLLYVRMCGQVIDAPSHHYSVGTHLMITHTVQGSEIGKAN